MSLQATVWNDGYCYTEEITRLSATQIQKSQQIFDVYKTAGMIILGSYESDKWVCTDGVRPRVTINLTIDEIGFARDAARKLGCTSKQYKQALRVAITSNFGYSLQRLQAYAKCLTNFAKTLQLPSEFDTAELLTSVLELLPGETPWRTKTIEQLQEKTAARNKSRRRHRTLAEYQSYFLFHDYLCRFWNEATLQEKLVYFPVYFWWTVTCILPLRPVECVQTPRECIRQDEMGRYYLTIRRTRLKTHIKSTRYNVDDDFIKQEWHIPKTTASEILWYLDYTKNNYSSKSDVLFCKKTQFDGFDIGSQNNGYYTTNNLDRCLEHFYFHVLIGRYGLSVTESETLLDKEIKRIQLGDTRHLAMISLMISGGSPSICRELAGHAGIEIGANYYSNIETFLDLLAYERFRPQAYQFDGKDAHVLIDRTIPVDGGYCQSPLIKQDDFSHCAAAINADGEFGVCQVCRYFLPKGKTVKLRQEASQDLQQTLILLRQILKQLRDDHGAEETLSCVLDRLRADAERYCNASAIELILKEKM